jgi:putative transport protein
MDLLRTALEAQPLMALFFTVAIGALLGELTLKGFSLGVGAVLFVALAVGAFAPGAAPPAILGTFGLSLFLYAVGLQCGKQFFQGLKSAAGLKANLAALTGVLLSGAATLLLLKGLRLPVGPALGLFAGSGTSTPALQAAIATLGQEDPAVGYSVAYPFGVAGPILLLSLGVRILKPRLEPPPGTGPELTEIAVRRAEHFGKRLGELSVVLPADVRIVALRRDHRNRPASPELVLEEHDVLLATAPTRLALDQAVRCLGEEAPGRLTHDRRDLDYLRVFASRSTVVGRTLRDLPLPGDRASIVVQVRRGDADLLPAPDLVVEAGDRVGVLAHRSDFPAMRKFFGDSIRGTAEFSYISIGLGMAVGFLLGAVRIPIPGIGRLTMGLSGVLLLALVLGNFRRFAGLNFMMPASANLVLRNLGLMVFIAQVGLASGPKFVATVSQTGVQMLGLGAVVLAALVLPILLLGLFVFRMPYDEVAGIVAGACGNPAILAQANRLAPTEAPDLKYATIFPGATLLKILFVSIVPHFL